MNATPTRQQLKDAIRIVAEGRGVHGLHAFEDAQSVVKSVSRFYWRQSAVMVSASFAAFAIAQGLNVTLIWELLAFVAIGALFWFLTLGTPLLGSLLAPRGLRTGDVADAFGCEMRSS